MILHKKQEHSDIKIKCDDCNMKFEEFRNQAKLKENTYCEICDKTFSLSTNYMRHVKKLHEEIWSCGKNHENLLKNSNSDKNGDKNGENKNDELYSCSLCLQEFDRRCDLRLHKRTVHINLPCDGCNKKFENPVKLRKHKSKAHDFVHCDKCGKSIIRGNYRRHLRAVHVDKGRDFSTSGWNTLCLYVQKGGSKEGRRAHKWLCYFYFT